MSAFTTTTGDGNVRINFVGITELFLGVGPKRAVKKLKKEVVMLAATEFDRRVNGLAHKPKIETPAPQKRPSFKQATPEIIEAEIVDISEAPPR